MHDRSFYEKTVRGYLAAVDRLDADGVLEFFGEDPLLVMEPMGMVMRGRGEVHSAFKHLLGESGGMKHEVLNWIVDLERRHVAIELNYHDTPKAGGATAILHDSTHLHFDAAGKLEKVQAWLGHNVA